MFYVKSLLLAASILFSGPEVAGEDSLLVLFWNLENFFDWRRDTTLASDSEAEFTSFGKRHWTKSKFMRKCRAISKTVFWLADEYQMMPDVIGFAEVENRRALNLLLKETSLRRFDYEIIHYDSPDPRGIDVALLYRKKRLRLSCSKPLRPYSREGPAFLTRDILCVSLLRENGDSVAFLVNHHPSKYGENSEWRRESAMARLGEATDSLFYEGYRDIISMGDFNDTPESTEGYSKSMINLAAPLARRGAGTIKYSGKWEMIDMFFISPAIAASDPGVRMRVEKPPFLMVRDNTHSGEKPFRAYTGPRYTGGVSDHCPITLFIRYIIR